MYYRKAIETAIMVLEEAEEIPMQIEDEVNDIMYKLHELNSIP